MIALKRFVELLAECGVQRPTRRYICRGLAEEGVALTVVSGLPGQWGVRARRGRRTLYWLPGSKANADAIAAAEGGETFFATGTALDDLLACQQAAYDAATDPLDPGWGQ